jgi:flagellar biogenesis protein FliO
MKPFSCLRVLAITLLLALDAYGEPASRSPEDESALEAEDELEADTLGADATPEVGDQATVAAPAVAQKNYLRAKAPEPAPTPKAESSPWRMAAAGVLLLALGAVAFHLRRKRSPLNLRGSQVQLSVVTRLAVTPKAQLALVSVGREALLLGVTEQGITTLRSYSMAELPSLTFPPEVEPKAPVSSLTRPAPAPSAPSPGQAFQSLLEKASGAKAVDQEMPEHLARALDDAGLLSQSFDAPEGQAQELAKRFRELHS